MDHMEHTIQLAAPSRAMLGKGRKSWINRGWGNVLQYVSNNVNSGTDSKKNGLKAVLCTVLNQVVNGVIEALDIGQGL
jgi:hypothetical protein